MALKSKKYIDKYIWSENYRQESQFVEPTISIQGYWEFKLVKQHIKYQVELVMKTIEGLKDALVKSISI